MFEDAKKSGIVACGVEGDLRRNGNISFILVVTDSDMHVFDVQEQSKMNLNFLEQSGLKAVLESADIVKVMRGCSAASDALLHLYGVLLCNVWDIGIGQHLLNPNLAFLSSDSLASLGINPKIGKSGHHRVLAIMRSERPQSAWEQRPLPGYMLTRAKECVASLSRIADDQAENFSPELEIKMRDQCQQEVCRLRDCSVNGTANLRPGEVVEYQVTEGELELLEAGEIRSQVRPVEILWEQTPFLDLLPVRLRNQVESHSGVGSTVDLVMDVGRPAVLRYRGPDGNFEHFFLKGEVTDAALKTMCKKVEPFSPKGRAVVPGTLHRVSAMRDAANNPVGLTIRVGRHVTGCITPLEDILGGSVLIIGAPGTGKTTILRGISAWLSTAAGKRVVIVDGSNEIAGEGKTPHACVGHARRIMSKTGSFGQEMAMIEAVENHTPEVIIVDEVSTKEQAQAARTIRHRGVDIICTCHGQSLWDLIRNTDLSTLIGGISSVILGGKDPRYDGTKKTVQERYQEPLFDTIIEVHKPNCWLVHRNASTAIDEMLAGKRPIAELREYTEDGRMLISRVAT